jgi:hypothetical protein
MPSRSIGQTWVLASIGAVVEMGVLSNVEYIETTAYGVYPVPWSDDLADQISVQINSWLAHYALNFHRNTEFNGRDT